MQRRHLGGGGGGGGAMHPTSEPDHSSPASDRPHTVRIRKLQTSGSAIVPGELLNAIKNQRVDSLYLQRQSARDYFLTVAHPEQKQRLLFLATMYYKDVAYWIDDPGRKVTFVNIFGTPYELSDVVLQAHLRKYGTIIFARRGRYHSHPEVENEIRHVRKLLRKNIPTTLHVGPLQVSGAASHMQ